MINILFLIDHIWNSNGGTEGQLLMLLQNLDPQKYKVHLFCLKATPWSQSARVDFPLHVLYMQKLLHPSNIPKLLKFRRYCRQNRIDIIQTYFNDALILGVIAGRLAGVKKIIACRRNLGPGFWNRKDLLFAFKALRPFVTRYMANSQATRDSIVKHEGIDPGKVDVIYNGLDLRRFAAINDDMRIRKRRELGLSDSHVLIGMVAHLRKEKNIELFVEAAARLHARHPLARFILLGEGGEKERIEILIKSLELESVVTMTGSIMDIVPYLAAMDIACLTSNGESFSNSIIEYQAAGLPVVASEVGGNLEAISAKDFLFPLGDLRRFVSILEALIANRELRLDTGRAGRELAWRRYSVPDMVSGHEALYQKCLSD
jgi:glycosyltransferase involved in cell wall biosynthesis